MDGTLPRVNPAHLRVWDPNRRLCSGYLFKKGGGRNWNKRLFVVDLDLAGDHDNYKLRYYKAYPGDPKGQLNLEGTSVAQAASSCPRP